MCRRRIQNSIENGINGLNPPGTADQTIQATEDAPVQFTLNAVNPTNTALTTTVSQSPNGSVSCSGINCTYAPNLNFNGKDTFTFSVNNGSAFVQRVDADDKCNIGQQSPGS